MPASIKLQQQYGDAIQVLFVESQGATADAAESFAWRQKGWMGVNAMWTTEPPVKVDGNTLPKFALLDIEGNMILSGNPLDQKKKIEEAIAEQVKKAKGAPAETPAKLAKCWSGFVKGDIGAAISECDKLAAADASLAGAAAALRAEMVARTNTRIARGTWFLDNGFVDQSKSVFADLMKSVKGCADFDDPIAAQMARVLLLEDPILAESEAVKALAPILARMGKEKAFDDANVKALQKIADKHKDTRAGKRAAQLVILSKIKPQ